MEYPDVPRLPYDEVRPRIVAGDILLCAGTAPLSWLIRTATGSVFSHVALLYWLLERLMVVESVESIGSWMIPVRRYVTDSRGSGRPYPGRLFVARHPNVANATEEDKFRLGQFALDSSGLRYSDEEIRRIRRILMTPAALRRPYVPPDLLQAKEYICSQKAAAGLSLLQTVIPYNERGFIAPQDLAEPPVEILFEIATDYSEA